MSYAPIQDCLSRGEMVLLDGGVGTEIYRRGVYWRSNGIERNPDIVRQVHADYIAAGADGITTNTFQLTRRSYLNLFHDIEHMRHIGPEGLENKAGILVRRAVELALEARERTGSSAAKGVAIAGSVSPLQHCFRPELAPPNDELRTEHGETVQQLKEAGVDFLLLETMNNIREAVVACDVARTTNLPFWVSFAVREEGKLLSRESIADAARAVEPFGPDAILVNCGPIEDITLALSELAGATRRPIGCYAHIGRYNPPSWKHGFFPHFVETEKVPPEKYLSAARQWAAMGAQIIGGCCGTTPAHIQALRSGLPRASAVRGLPKSSPPRQAPRNIGNAGAR